MDDPVDEVAREDVRSRYRNMPPQNDGAVTKMPTPQREGVPTSQREGVPTPQRERVLTPQRERVPTPQREGIPIPTPQRERVPTSQRPTPQSDRVPVATSQRDLGSRIVTRVSPVQSQAALDDKEKQNILNSLTALQSSMLRIERQEQQVIQKLTSLENLIDKLTKENFTIKDSRFESSLIKELAEKCCTNIFREVPVETMRSIVTDKLGSVASDQHKFDLAMQYCRERVTRFRSDERRKVLGLRPFQHYQYFTTHELALSIINSTKAPAEVYDIYLRNLILLRKFVRTAMTSNQNLYLNFRTWIQSSFSVITEDGWEILLTEDASYDYSLPTTVDPVVVQAQDIEEEIENQDNEYDASHHQ